MKDKGTWSRYVLVEYVKENYFAKFHKPDIKFWYFTS